MRAIYPPCWPQQVTGWCFEWMKFSHVFLTACDFLLYKSRGGGDVNKYSEGKPTDRNDKNRQFSLRLVELHDSLLAKCLSMIPSTHLFSLAASPALSVAGLLDPIMTMTDTSPTQSITARADAERQTTIRSHLGNLELPASPNEHGFGLWEEAMEKPCGHGERPMSTQRALLGPRN